MQSRRAKGFSLIELMTVVLIVAILTVLAFPNFATWLQNSRTRSVAESMQNGLRFAQGEAARLSRLTTFTPAGTGWSVTYTKITADPTTGTNVLQTAVDSNLGTVTTTPTTAISFNSFGRAGTVSGGVFSLAANDTTYAITNSSGTRQLKILVSPGGKVHMCDPDKTFDINTAPDGCP